MSIISTGLSHKTVPIGLREKFYTSAEALPAILSKIKKDSKYIEEIAIVSTCNRFEIYAKVNNTINAKVEIVKFLTDHFLVNSNSLSKIRYISKILYSNDEQNAYRHLMEVASGLDSMIVGEDQILGTSSECFRNINTSRNSWHFYTSLIRIIFKGWEKSKN